MPGHVTPWGRISTRSGEDETGSFDDERKRGLISVEVQLRGEGPHHRLSREVPMSSTTIEISQELKQRIDGHLEEDETYEEFLAELLSIYETQGTFMQEGYSE